MIGLFGSLTVAEAELLSGLRGNGATCIGFVIDSSTWVNLPPATGRRPTGRTRPPPLALVRSGWRSVPVAHGELAARALAGGRPRLAGLRVAGGDGRDGRQRR